MIIELDIRDIQIARDVKELQMASYKIEAEIMDFYDIPPLKDTIDDLQGCNEIFYGYNISGSLAGMISYKIIESTLDIHRVAIHPSFFRMGIASKLINFVEELESNIERIVVCTGKENLPAVSLYLKNGYKKKKDIEIETGIYITKFEKMLT